jgi:hypothetical protein
VSPAASRTQSVFLNVPFDRRYRPLFLSLVAGLTGLGRTPRCVLEVPSSGTARLERIFDLIARSGASIHDLSRASLSGPLRVPRFNMPFELGLAYAVARRGRHSFFLFEEKPYRLQASLSDLNGHDPHIHGGTEQGILRCMLDCFGKPEGAPEPQALYSLTVKLSKVVAGLQRQQGVDHPFHPHIFRQTVQAAAELARLEGLIR